MIKKTKVKAVAYIRMSTGTQVDSPAQQHREIESLAAKRDYDIIRW